MTAWADHSGVSASATSTPERATAEPDSAELRAWNEALNRTHAMNAWRARSGRVVRTIEARRRRLVSEAVLRSAPRRVVDVGCEDGWIAEGYVEHVEHLFLADIDRHVLAACPLSEQDNVSTVVTDATQPTELAAALGDGGADVIVLSALLEHLPEPELALAGLAPLLGDGGRFVIYVPADGPILFVKRVLRATRLGHLIKGLSLDPAPGHLHVFDRRAFSRLIAPYGEIESLTFDPLCLGYLAVVRRTSAEGA